MLMNNSPIDGALRDARVEVAAAETPDPGTPSDAAQVVDPIGNCEVVAGVVLALVVARTCQHIGLIHTREITHSKNRQFQ
jgi:hypothetical protein